MTTFRSVGEAAAILSKATGQPAESIARQIRSWVQQGIVVPTTREHRGTSGKIVAAMFNMADVAALRLVMALSTESIPTLTNVWRDMHGAVDARLELPPIDGTFPPRGIDAVVAGLLNNEPHVWSFNSVWKLNTRTGERFPMSGFIRDDQKPYPESDPRSLAPMWTEADLLVERTTVVHATEILRPMLDAIKN